MCSHPGSIRKPPKSSVASLVGVEEVASLVGVEEVRPEETVEGDEDGRQQEPRGPVNSIR